MANPVGTGPFKLKEWVRGSHVHLVRHDGYYRKDEPHLDEIIYRIIPAFYLEIASALSKHYAVSIDTLELPVIVRFGSWVGGDMETSADVHAKSIRETLARAQRVIIGNYHRECLALAQMHHPGGHEPHRAVPHSAARHAVDHPLTSRPHALPRTAHADRRATAGHLRGTLQWL